MGCNDLELVLQLHADQLRIDVSVPIGFWHVMVPVCGRCPRAVALVSVPGCQLLPW